MEYLLVLQQHPVLVSGSHERGRSYLALKEEFFLLKKKKKRITISEHDENSNPSAYQLNIQTICYTQF